VQVGDQLYQVAHESTLLQLAEKHYKSNDFVAARVNNAVTGLGYRLHKNCTVEFLDCRSDDGMRIYRNSLVFLLVRAAKEVLVGCRVHMKHSLSNGLYGEIDFERPVGERDIDEIDQRMHEIVMENVPFERKKLSIDDASKLFFQQGLHVVDVATVYVWHIAGNKVGITALCGQ